MRRSSSDRELPRSVRATLTVIIVTGCAHRALPVPCTSYPPPPSVAIIGRAVELDTALKSRGDAGIVVMPTPVPFADAARNMRVRARTARGIVLLKVDLAGVARGELAEEGPIAVSTGIIGMWDRTDGVSLRRGYRDTLRELLTPRPFCPGSIRTAAVLDRGHIRAAV